MQFTGNQFHNLQYKHNLSLKMIKISKKDITFQQQKNRHIFKKELSRSQEVAGPARY